MKKSLYSAGISSRNRSGGICVSTCAIVAIDEDSAIGHAIKYAINMWPREDDYCEHQVTVFKIPQSMIDKVS